MGAPSSRDVRARWTAPGTGQRYDEARWRHAGRRRRDPDTLTRLLRDVRAESPGRPAPAWILDAPCGTTRLRSAVEGLFPTSGYVGLDASPSMLGRGAGGDPTRLVCGDVEHLPFGEGAFDIVVCCRLLHHLHERAPLESALRELVRVSAHLVVGSFWDTRSLEAQAMRLPFARTPRHRITRSRAELTAALDAAGADVVRWRSTLPVLSRQTWFAAVKR